MMRVIEQSQVSPPPNSLPSPSTLPLTFLDISWFYCKPPLQRIFFYHFPHPTHYFLQTTLPILKHSLSITLQHFFPFSSNLIIPPNSQNTPPYIRYLDGNSLSPSPSTEQDGTFIIPLTAIQITILPNSGFSICVLKHPTAPKLTYLQKIQDFVKENMEFTSLVRDAAYANKVRTSLVLSRDEVQKMKRWVIDKCKDSTTPHMSTFVVTCSLFWFCMVKSEQSKSDCVGDDLVYFIFYADCRDRAEFSLPKTYFGNCLASYIVVVKRDELVGKDGIVVVANAIERKIRDFKSDALLGVETLIPDYREIIKPGNSVVLVSGSPKLDVYETDFGWGKPKKSDAVHIDSFGSISLSDCRDGGGGIEVGFALERSQMTNFINIYKEQLGDICSI